MFQIGRREQLIVLVILAALIFGGGYRYAQYKGGAVVDQPALVSAGEEIEQSDAEPKEIVVHVSGEVEKPGVYRLFVGDRVIAAVEMAQPKVDADLDGLNLAAPLTDGQKILVPPKIELTADVQEQAIPSGNASPFVSQVGSQTSALVNLNNADMAQLDTLPGIGPALAQRIIDFRQANGGFKTVEDLKNVSGIGDKKYQDLKDMVSIY